MFVNGSTGSVAHRPQFTLILPAYNEVDRIGQTIEEARSYFRQRQITYEIIVSADGADGTRELVVEMGRSDPALKLIGTAERRGKGHGIREAVRLARGDIIGFIDADNKTPVGEIDKVAPLLRDGCDLVIGSRLLPESRIERRQPLYRRLGSKAFSTFVHLFIGLRDIVDTQCGFKFFQRNVALDLFGRQRIDGYMFDVEVLYLARLSGYRIMQSPVRWRDDGDSRLCLFTGNIRNALDILKIRFANSRRSTLRAQNEPTLSRKK